MTGSSAVSPGSLTTQHRMWAPSTSALLVIVGMVLAVTTFSIAINMPELRWDSAADAGLRAAYERFRATGTLPNLLALTDGSTGALACTVWQDSRGAYVVAWLMGNVTGSESPYPGLALAQALLMTAPLTWLPTATARIFLRARAGYALVLLPPLVWLLNNGTVLLGTEYGLTDESSNLRVPALYGLTASMSFLAMSLILLLSTYRLRGAWLVGTSVALAVLSAVVSMFSLLAGVGSALAIGVLWMRAPRGRRVVRLTVASLTCLVVVLVLHRSFDAMWSDRLYGDVVRSLGLIADNSSTAPDSYARRLLTAIKHYGAMIAFIMVGFVVAGTRRAPQRRPLAAALAVALPTLLLGIMQPVLGTASLFDFSLLSSTLGLLTAVSLAALVWSITSMPAHFRSVERNRLTQRSGQHFTIAPRLARVRMSTVVPTRNGEGVLQPTLDSLGRELSARDEIVVVENGSTDGTSDLLTRIQKDWKHAPALVVTHSPPGLGAALRTGVLASGGGRLLLTADDLPFGFSDLDQFRRLPEDVTVAIGSKAHADSKVRRSFQRTIQSHLFRFLREALLQSRVGDSQGTLWVDGDWGRNFAHLSRESGLMWTTELVLAAEQQHVTVREVPVLLEDLHESGTSRFRLSDAWHSVVGFTRLAVYKDDYCNEDWVRFTRPTDETAAMVR